MESDGGGESNGEGEGVMERGGNDGMGLERWRGEGVVESSVSKSS